MFAGIAEADNQISGCTGIFDGEAGAVRCETLNVRGKK